MEAADEYLDERFEEPPAASPAPLDEHEQAYTSPDEEDGVPFDEEEEEVHSVPAADELTHPKLAPPAAAKVSSFPSLLASVAPAPRASGLPSLFPSIGGSSSLTQAGRAHFATASLFGNGKAAAAPAPAAASTAAPSNELSTEATPEQLRAYADSNAIWASESLGIHAVVVSPAGGGSGVASYVSVDGGKLKLWAGTVGAFGDSAPAVAATPAGSADAPFTSSVFLRGALCSSSAALPDESAFTDETYVHIFVDAEPPPPALDTLVDDLGQLNAHVATLPPCFHLKRLGAYRLRLLAQASAMPDLPDSFENFVARAQLQVDGEVASAGTNAGQIVSAFDIQPITTLFVSVEKLKPPPSTSSSNVLSANTRAATTTVLPPLPLNSPQTFWLSTHQPGRACSLLFSSPSSSSSNAVPLDQFELTLDIAPLHATVLDLLNVRDPRLDLEGEEDEADERTTTTSRKDKRKAKAAAKKRANKAARNAANTTQTTQAQPVPLLVEVSLAAAANPSSANDLVVLSFGPASSSSAATPLLEDLLATLSVSSTPSLPSSILGAHQSRDVLAAQLTNGSVGPHGSAAASSAAASSPSNGSLASAAVPASSGATSAASSLLLATLSRTAAWPFAVDLTAMRLSDEAEGHASFSDLDLLHNRPLGRRGASSADRPQGVLVGDHEVTILRTVGLLCAWERPNDSTPANATTHALHQPVLVSQTPQLSYHVQVRIERLDAEEAQERDFAAVLG